MTIPEVTEATRQLISQAREEGRAQGRREGWDAAVTEALRIISAHYDKTDDIMVERTCERLDEAIRSLAIQTPGAPGEAAGERVCHVCGAWTDTCCSDCAIDSGGAWKVYVCGNKTSCLDRHEAMANCRPAPAPTVPTQGEGRPTDSKANAEWLRTFGRAYAGNWVGLKDGLLLDHGPSRSELTKRLRGNGRLEGATLVLVERGDHATPAAQGGAKP